MGLMDKWTSGERVAPEPLEGPVVATTVAGTLLWLALFLGQLPFYGWFADNGHAWWVWTCAAGAGLGVIGIWYVRRRDAAIRKAEADAAPGSTSATDTTAAPDAPGTPDTAGGTRPESGAGKDASGRD